MNNYALLIEQSPLATQILGRDGKTLQVNTTWEKLWGVPFTALADYNLLQDPQLIAAGVVAKLHEVFAGACIQFPEMEYDRSSTPEVSGSGGKLWVRTHAYPIRNESGHIEEIVLLQEDTSLSHVNQERVRLYQKIFERSNDAIAIIDPAGHYLEQNQAHRNLLGYDDQDLIGLTPAIYLGETAYASLVHELTASGNASGEYPARTKSGAEKLLYMSAFSLKNDDGSVRCHVGIKRDITEQKRAAQALQESEQRFRDLFEKSPDPCWIINEDNLFMLCNQAAADLLGYDSIAELAATHPSRLSPEIQPDGRTSFEHANAMMARAHAQGVHRFEWTHQRKNGECFPVEVTLAHIEFAGHKQLYCVWRDISARKATEEKLRVSEERFAFAMAGANDGLWDWNLLTNEVYYSPRWCTMLGYQPDELPATLDTWGQLVHPADKDRTLAHVTAYLNGETERYEAEFRMRHKAGAEVVILARARMVLKHDGQPIRLVGTHVDITERKQTEQALRTALSVQQATLESTADGILVVADNGKWSAYNQKFIDIWQIPAEIMASGDDQQALSHVLSQLADPQAFIDKVLALYAAPEATSFDLIKFKDGRFFERYSTAQKIGEQIVGRVWSFRDVTERHLAELRLRESEEKYRGIFDDSVAAIYVFDNDKRFIDSNQAGLELLGYSRDELLRLRIPDVDADHGAVQPAHRHLLSGGRIVNFEHRLVRKDGQIITVLNNSKDLTDDAGEVIGMQSTLLDITERKRAEEQIQQLAYYDYLTGLPNRRLFRDRLVQEIKWADRNHTGLALLYIDLDRFKEINDTLGHDKGDQLLIEATGRIQQHVRKTDSFARLGGDEFIILLPQHEESANIDRVVQSVLQDLSTPFDLGDGDQGHISCSIGIVLYPQDAANVDELLRHADQAMYAAKSKGRNGFSYFTRKMQAEAERKVSLTNDLRQALAAQQLEVYYQPIVEAHSGRIVKAEALLRWHHPTLGMLSPCVFIPLAEESGLIIEIGEWVFMEALRTLLAWRDSTGQLIPMSVNKSPVQFIRAERHPWLEHYLSSTLPENSITVEITESLLLSDSNRVKDELDYFRQQGIEVSIDDFGTGFSALSYLNRFHIDYLKIDRSFVQDITTQASSRALTEAIIIMAHKLGIRTIAEGVETEAQRDILLEMGCDYLQGFLYSRPITASAFQALLTQKR